MATISTWNLHRDEMDDLADNAKALVVAALVDEGELDKDIGNEWCKTHTLVLRKKTMFRTLLEKIVQKESEQFVVVKRV